MCLFHASSSFSSSYFIDAVPRRIRNAQELAMARFGSGVWFLATVFDRIHDWTSLPCAYSQIKCLWDAIFLYELKNKEK